MKLQSRVFNAMIYKLAADRRVIEDGPWVFMPGHEIRFNPTQTRTIDSVMIRFQSSPYSPPTVKECQAAVGEDVYQALVDTGMLVPVASDVVFSKDGYERMLDELRSMLEDQGTVTAAQVRDHFNTSRKYALAFLEYLDERGVTIREGDVRKLHN